MNSKDVPKVQMPAGKPAQVKKTGDALQDQHLELVAMMNSDLAAVRPLLSSLFLTRAAMFVQLKESLATCKTHSKAVAKAQLADTPSLETLDPTRSKWSLGDLSAFSTLAKEAEKRVSESKASASGLKKGVADLQSQLLKGAGAPSPFLVERAQREHSSSQARGMLALPQGEKRSRSSEEDSRSTART